MQDDLRAYDFESAPAEDIFGALMAQLANRSQRLLLGQELTPAWLAKKLVEEVFNKLPHDEVPRLVDMCCGSGAMVVEAVEHAAKRLEAAGIAPGAAGIKKLSMVISGFDIDPLAVILAKVGWVLAARKWLAGLSPGEISIPIYHADSLFAATPLAKTVDADSGATHYELRLDNKVLALPGFLVSSKHKVFFDTLLERGYTMAMASANQASSTLTGAVVEALVRQALKESGDSLTTGEEAETLTFCKALLDSLDALQRAGRNGIWVFVLRNSYRPGLVTSQFNGLVSNPPWLALSKVADNPYKDALRVRAENYGVKPEGSSHLHIELATIFLLHAIERYLASNAVIGCVLPESVLSAHHHNPFRKADYLAAKKRVPFIVDEIWRVEKGTFKNEAIVLFGRKKVPGPAGDIAGKLASRAGLTDLTFHRISQGRRTAWTDKAAAGAGKYGFFSPAEFREGADIMPRTLVFHDCTRVAGMAAKWNLRPVDRSVSDLRYLVSGAKIHKTFNLTANNVDDKFIFDVLLSHQLTPFSIDVPAKGFLPIEKNEADQWVSVPETRIATFGATTSQAFDAIFKAMGPTFTSQQYFEKLDSIRGKLSSQSLPTEGWLVFMGAGGDLVCAAHEYAQTYRADKTIIDQTLYWAAVPTEDEALYLVGLLNSEAVNLVIKEFQPRGQFGARHVHKLPLGATPPFNPADVAHSDVVVKTRNLLTDWKALKTMDPEITELLNPNSSRLHIRRAKLRVKLKSLDSYEDYELACKSLYGV
jgi:methylase of polypeptide subunit release factors